jgi:hypothetical protein
MLCMPIHAMVTTSRVRGICGLLLHTSEKTFEEIDRYWGLICNHVHVPVEVYVTWRTLKNLSGGDEWDKSSASVSIETHELQTRDAAAHAYHQPLSCM